MERSTSQKFDKIARVYNNPIIQSFYLWAHRSCLNFLKDCIKDDYCILDIACGTGIFLKKISRQHLGLKLFGIDSSKEMINIANRNPGTINFGVADAEKIPFEDNSFDLITVIDAFYYFRDKKNSLKECSRLLKPGRHLFLFYPAIDIFPSFVLKIIKAASRLFLFNSEEYSTFPKIQELEKMAGEANMKLAKKDMKLLHRFILFTK